MRRLILVCLVSLASLGAVAATAQAEETLKPWWHLISSSRPSYLQPGQATDELQQLIVNTAAGSYQLRDEGAGLFERNGGNGDQFELTAGQTPKEVQEALEAGYGAGNVEVTSVPSLPPFEVYDIKFVGELTDLPVVPPEPVFGRRNGLEEPVTIKELAHGRPDGEIVVTATNLGDGSTPYECVKVTAGAGKYKNSACTEIAGSGEEEFEVELKEPVTLTDHLPPGLQATGIEGSADESFTKSGKKSEPIECLPLPALSCTFTGKPPASVAGGNPRRTYPKFVPPYQQLELRIAVRVTGSTPEHEVNESESNAVSVSGGGAPPASIGWPAKLSSEVMPFAVSGYEMRPEEATGVADAQAGSHPFQLTTSADYNELFTARPAGLVKDQHFRLPPGLIGNPTPFEQCTIAQFESPAPGSTGNFNHNQCTEGTVVGVARIDVQFHFESKRLEIPFTVPLYNLEPSVGEPARFGFVVEDTPVFLDTSVRTGGDYGVTVNITNVSQQIEFLTSEVTFWGVPGDARHNYVRGYECIVASEEASYGRNGEPTSSSCPGFSELKPPPLLALPTSCPANPVTGAPEPLHTELEVDSWEEPHNGRASANTAAMPALDGCNRLPFEPQIKVIPDGTEASKPTGLNVDVHLPQEGQLNPKGLAQSNVRDITVTLPQGVILNPSAADGLEGCSARLIGYEGSKEFGISPGVSYPGFTPYLPGSTTALAAGDGESLQPGVNFCPNASKIAEATIKTPLLPAGQYLKGFVYLASPQNFASFPQENPFSKHVAMYIVAEDPISGSLVKLPGKVELGGEPGVEGLAPGQIRSTFEDNPQLAFEDAELHFFGGERAPLASPSRCGNYTTNATFTPWSGGEPVNSSSSFEVTSGPNGSPCPGSALPFAPSLASGTTSNNAGGFSSLTTTMSRPDGDQSIQSVTLHYPAGLSGLLSGVELCPEAQANAGTCGPNSQIGETIVSVGVGGDPFTVTGGKAYITGPYEGAPFGLSIVNPAKAGPFDLQEGRPVVVRAKIEVDPHTAALTITTNTPQEGYAIPTIIEGFPLQIQHVNVLVNRPGFTFNPTNCSKTEVTGEIRSAEGASSTIADPFQATNCQALKFTPKFTVSTSGKTSKANGASLTTKVEEPAGSMGTQANIAKVKVELPKQLPSRLTTLQKACTAAQFEANPAACPSASFIGHAVVHTPLVPVPLEGPAIFVSHGGEAFPSLEIVLQGYGVKIILVGATFISKSGITSTTFHAIPDQPFNTFELTLPEGLYSALAANGNLCALTTTKTVKKKVTVRVKGHKRTVTRKVRETVAGSLEMPNEFVAQNGAEIHEDTPISVTGCAKRKPANKSKKKKNGKRKKG